MSYKFAMENIVIKGIFYSLIVFTISACTSVQVAPINKAKVNDIQQICIVENPKVVVDDFVPVIQKRLQYHGITSRLVENEQGCEYTLHYSAKRSWDFKAYLSWAELNLYHDKKIIAQAEYKLVGGGGLSLMKWQSVEIKMNPVVDELLGKK